MKKLSFTLLISIIFLLSCNKQAVYYTTNIDSLLAQHKAPDLATFIEQTNPVVTLDDYPPIIIAPIVSSELNQDLIIDIRRKDAYQAGHINGAYNVKPAEIFDFLNKYNVAAYKRIILVCYSGQMATYYAELLRLLGYKNAFSLAYGMAGWNREFGGLFKKNISAKYINKISKTDVNLPKNKTGLPPTPKGLPLTVLNEQVAKAANLSPKQYLISADQVFQNLDKYFIIDLRKNEHYKVGHIPGAINIRPNELLPSKKLAYLPKNKPIVVYCYHGYTSVATTAYLRVLGYDAYSLKFGYHSFMDGILNKRIDFKTVFNDFPYITGDKRLDIKLSKVQTNNQTGPKPQIKVPIKKKQVGGGCE